MYEIQYMHDGKKEVYATEKEWNERIDFIIENFFYDIIIEPGSHIALVDDTWQTYEERFLHGR